MKLRPSPLVAIALAAWLGACSDSGGPADPVVLSQGSDSAIVSDPVPTLAPSGAHASFSLVGSASIDLAYVSLQPGTIPEGELVTVRSPRTTGTVTAAMTGGGFDPLPIAANAGDSVQVTVSAGGRNLVSFMRAVPTTRRPVVIRTDPPPGKRDQPLNARIVVVFSEPVAGSTITTSSVQLFQGTTAVAGTVSLLGGTATAAVFDPAAPLDAHTEYQLVVTQGVKDLTGDALAADTSVSFTTGTTVVGTAAHHIMVLPDTVAIPIGSQLQLTVSEFDTVGNPISGRPIAWSTETPAVATVSNAGIVTALTAGEAHIRATVDFASGVGIVFVSGSSIPVSSVNLTPVSSTLPVGASIRLVAEPRDASGNILKYRIVTWSSSNPAVADVSSASGTSALIMSFSPGAATITAASEGKTGRASINVVTAQLPFVQLVAVYGHTCAVTTDSWAFCWGWTGGIGTGQQVTDLPAPLAGGQRFTQVASTCALTAVGKAYCWGSNGVGELGIGNHDGPEHCPPPLGTEPCSTVPVAVAGGQTFKMIENTCALTTGGRAYCWGPNAWGYLGIGNNTGPEDCGQNVPCSTAPVRVTGGLTFSSLSSTGDHTCALTAAGDAYCWGLNLFGQLGTGSNTGPQNCQGDPCSTSPVRVGGGLKFTHIAVGGAESCGLTAAGDAYCWGLNGHGELGLGINTGPNICTQRGGQLPACSWTPALVSGSLRWSAISIGSEHACGVTQGGAGYCWGVNWYGDLGAGDTTLTDCGYSGYGFNPTCSYTPIAVVGGLSFASISAGATHSCALTADRTAYCWGSNSGGELGIGSRDGVPHFTPLKVARQP